MSTGRTILVIGVNAGKLIDVKKLVEQTSSALEDGSRALLPTDWKNIHVYLNEGLSIVVCQIVNNFLAGNDSNNTQAIIQLCSGLAHTLLSLPTAGIDEIVFAVNVPVGRSDMRQLRLLCRFWAALLGPANFSKRTKLVWLNPNYRSNRYLTEIEELFCTNMAQQDQNDQTDGGCSADVEQQTMLTATPSLSVMKQPFTPLFLNYPTIEQRDAFVAHVLSEQVAYVPYGWKILNHYCVYLIIILCCIVILLVVLLVKLL